MSLRFVEAKPLVVWLQGQLQGATLQAIQHPDSNTLVLRLRQPGHTTSLLLATGSGRARLHTVDRAPPAPLQPLAFQGLLRKHLRGRLAHIALLEGERILRLRFDHPSGVSSSLLAELTDRHGNFFLLNSEDHILGAARRSSSTARALEPGRTWAAPAQHPGPSEDRYEGLDGPSRNNAIRDQYSARDNDNSLGSRKVALERMLRGRIKGLEKLLARQDKETARGEEARGLREEGDLLQSAFHQLQRGQDEISLPDFFSESGGMRRLALDPALSPPEQVEARYNAARRAKRSADQAGGRAATTRALLTQLRELQEQVKLRDDGDVSSLLKQLPAELQQEWSRKDPQQKDVGAAKSRSAKRRDSERRRLPYRSYSSPSGHEIRVGRGARDNDELTLRISRGNDLFLHVRGRPGAHVIVCSPGKTPGTELLLLAAQLAMAHSGIAHGDRAEVLWTRVKEVRKPRGMAAGAVLLRSEKVLYVEARREELERLVPLKN